MLVDTNVLIRLVTNDDPQTALRLKQRIADAPTHSLILKDAVLAEMCFVLQFNPAYRLDRALVTDALVSVLKLKALSHTAVAERAMYYFAHDAKLDFTDCLLVAEAVFTGRGLLTLDKRVQKLLAALKKSPESGVDITSKD